MIQSNPRKATCSEFCDGLSGKWVVRTQFDVWSYYSDCIYLQHKGNCYISGVSSLAADAEQLARETWSDARWATKRVDVERRPVLASTRRPSHTLPANRHQQQQYRRSTCQQRRRTTTPTRESLVRICQPERCRTATEQQRSVPTPRRQDHVKSTTPSTARTPTSPRPRAATSRRDLTSGFFCLLCLFLCTERLKWTKLSWTAIC